MLQSGRSEAHAARYHHIIPSPHGQLDPWTVAVRLGGCGRYDDASQVPCTFSVTCGSVVFTSAAWLPWPWPLHTHILHPPRQTTGSRRMGLLDRKSRGPMAEPSVKNQEYLLAYHSRRYHTHTLDTPSPVASVRHAACRYTGRQCGR